MKMKDETMTSSFQFMQSDYDKMKEQNKVTINFIVSCFSQFSYLCGNNITAVFFLA